MQIVLSLNKGWDAAGLVTGVVLVLAQLEEEQQQKQQEQQLPSDPNQNPPRRVVMHQHGLLEIYSAAGVCLWLFSLANSLYTGVRS